MSLFSDIGTFFNRTLGTQGGLLSDIGVSSVPKDVTEGLEIGAGLLGGGLLGAGLAGIGPLAAGIGGIGSDIGSALGFGGATATGGLGTAGAAATPLALTDVGTGLSTAPGIEAIGGATGGLDLGATIGPGVSATGGALDVGAPLGLGTAATAAAPAATSGGLLSTVEGALAPVSGALKTAAPILGLGGLGYNLYSGYEQNQALKQLSSAEQQNAATAAQTAATEQAAAAPLISSGQSLMNYLQTGTLPPAFQAQVQQAVQAAKAQIIQGYASRGMSSDPNQNSALAQDLANVDQQALTLQGNLETTLSTAGNQMVQTANSLLNTGLSATQLSSEIPIQVAQLNNSLNQSMAQSISSFAAALNGSGVKPGTATITLPTNVVGSSGNLNLGG